MPECTSRKYRQYSDNRHYSAYCHYWLFLSVPSDITGSIADNRHYPTGAIGGSLLCVTNGLTLIVSPNTSCPWPLEVTCLTFRYFKSKSTLTAWQLDSIVMPWSQHKDGGRKHTTRKGKCGRRLADVRKETISPLPLMTARCTCTIITGDLKPAPIPGLPVHSNISLDICMVQ